MDEKFFVIVSVMAMAFLIVVGCDIKRIGCRSGSQSNSFIVVFAVALVVLNQMVSNEDYNKMHIVATLVLYLCAYPLWRYLRFRERGIPFVPLLLLIYGIYFSVPTFFPFDPFISFRNVSDSARLQALYVVLCGLLSLLLAFYNLPKRVWSSWMPQLRPAGWSAPLAASFAMVLSFFGIIANIASIFATIPETLSAGLTFVSQFSLLSISILFYLQLRGQLPIIFRWALWVLIVPTQLMVDVSLGFMYPLIRDGFMMLMVFLFVKKSIPWLKLIPALMIVTVFLLSKSEFRRIAWAEGTSGPLESASIYAGIIQDTVLGSNSEALNKSLGQLTSRVDNGTLLAHVIEQTPQNVPYWGGETYLGMLWRFVPRFIWQNKPIEQLGQTFGHRYKIISPEDTNTSWNMPQIVEMFANFGWVGVILGMGSLGCLYNFLSHFLERHQTDEWGKLSCIVIYTSLLQVDGNFSLVFGNLVYWIVLFHLMGRVIFSVNARKNRVLLGHSRSYTPLSKII